jgi:carbamoyl-phosphate synthase large subunit
MSSPTAVMVAGIGGASLGTELIKALHLAGGYEVFGCDISSTAYGLYEDGLADSFLIDRENYVPEVLAACAKSGAAYLVPGGEQPMVLLAAASKELQAAGITLVANSTRVVQAFSDKSTAFGILAENGVPIPKTVAIETVRDLESVVLPCIVKPATGSGGSASVFFATSGDEAMIYAEFIRRGGSVALAQEYIGLDEGEFTIGVLSLPDRTVIGSIALRRALDAKLSVAYRGRGGVISSGYSQGHIGDYPDLCRQAETIAAAIGSEGPINVQGRVRDGTLLPFEINPRLSASTYLRACAGFNEVDLLLRAHIESIVPKRPAIQTGWYLRSLTERFVADERLR